MTTSSQDNFSSAAARHWDNSAFLAHHNRYQEAAYLAGYAAECALKTLVQIGDERLGGKTFGHNLVNLSGDGLTLALLLSPTLRRYPLQTPPPNNPQWREESRYHATDFSSAPQFQTIINEAHQTAGRILIGLTLDGFLEAMPQ